MDERERLPGLEPDPVIEHYKRFLDVGLIRENLKLSHEQRLLRLQALQDLAQELGRAGREALQRDSPRP